VKEEEASTQLGKIGGALKEALIHSYDLDLRPKLLN